MKLQAYYKIIYIKDDRMLNERKASWKDYPPPVSFSVFINIIIIFTEVGEVGMAFDCVVIGGKLRLHLVVKQLAV